MKLLLFLFLVPFSAAQSSEPVQCKITSGDDSDWHTIQCDNLGIDSKTLGQVLRQTQYTFQNGTRKPFTDLAPIIAVLRVHHFKKAKIEENTFTELPNLETLQFEGSEVAGEAPLDIPASELAKIPKLRSITVDRCTLTDNTIRAILGVKDRLKSISVWNTHPQQDILGIIGQLSNLTEIFIQNICENPSVAHPIPGSIFQKSADKLRKIWVSDCRLPTITRDLFKGLKNARSIMWTLSHIRTIQDGAFDDLVNLEELNLMGNQIRTLPDGLFKKMKKLNEVNLRFNGVQNLSRNNFTDVDSFNFFVLDVSQE